MKIPGRWTPPHNKVPWYGKTPAPEPVKAPINYYAWSLALLLPIVAGLAFGMMYRDPPEPALWHAPAADIVATLPSGHDDAKWIPAGSGEGPPLPQVKRFETYDGGHCDADNDDPRQKRKGLWCYKKPAPCDIKVGCYDNAWAAEGRANQNFTALSEGARKANVSRPSVTRGDCVVLSYDGIVSSGGVCGGGGTRQLQFNNSGTFSAPLQGTSP